MHPHEYGNDEVAWGTINVDELAMFQTIPGDHTAHTCDSTTIICLGKFSSLLLLLFPTICHSQTNDGGESDR